MESEHQKVAIVGLGNWGVKVLRMFETSMPHVEVALVDVNPTIHLRRSHGSESEVIYPQVHQLNHPNSFDLFIVTTPASQHKTVLLEIAKIGGNALVEKPFCDSIQAAGECQEVFRNLGLSLSVGHIFLHSERFFDFRSQFNQLIKHGRPLQYMSQRLDFGSFPPDVGCTEHLMYHDLYILDELFGLERLRVTQFEEEKRGGTQNLWSRMVLGEEQSGSRFVLEVSELSAEKVRRIEIQSDENRIVWDDVSPYAYQKSPLQRMMEAALRRTQGQNSVCQSMKVKQFIEACRC